jgi:ubiquinone/menaquinone biosynthesis C-methylase UbiE
VAVPDSERTASQYDAMAVEYANDNDDNSWNAYYERPATIELLGDVAGLDVLEVGCGSGPLTEWLVAQGARVTAFDVSPRMLQLAKERVGDSAQFLVADVTQPLTFAADQSIDIVVASLVLHYIEHWEPVLTELRRALRPDGTLVFSTHHPAMDWRIHSPDDYFAKKQITETWDKGPGHYEVTFWRRPLTEMTAAIGSAGFVIDKLIEPKPVPELEATNRRHFRMLSTRPQFLFFRLRVLA